MFIRFASNCSFPIRDVTYGEVNLTAAHDVIQERVLLHDLKNTVRRAQRVAPNRELKGYEMRHA